MCMRYTGKWNMRRAAIARHLGRTDLVSQIKRRKLAILTAEKKNDISRLWLIAPVAVIAFSYSVAELVLTHSGVVN